MKNGRTVATRDAPKKRELIFFQDNCTGCGMCCEVCASNAIRLGPTGAIARGVVDAAYLAVNEDCTLCGLCARVCMFDALALHIDGVREEYDALGNVDVKGGCKFCKLCEEVCPRDAVVVHRTMPGMKELVSVPDGTPTKSTDLDGLTDVSSVTPARVAISQGFQHVK